MNLPAGTTCLYDPAMDTYTFVFANGTQFKFTGLELQQMTHPGLMSYTGLGGLHGGYRTPTQTTHSSSPHGAYSGDPRVQAQIALYQSQLATHQAALANLYPGGITNLSTGGMTFIGNTFEQSTPPVVEYAGIKGGEIIAYRCWLIAGSILKGFVLTSCFVETKWNPGEPMTGCVGYDYGICTGVHSFKTKKLALEYGQGYKFNLVALGRVKLWGEVVEHEKGYRAENAKIMSIDQILNPKDDQLILRKLRKRYGVNEYANGNNTGNGERGSETEQDTGSDQEFRGNDLSGISSSPRKGGYWSIIRNFLQR